MKVFALIAAVLVASSSALDTAEFTFANSKLQKFKDAVAAQASSSADSIYNSLNNEFGYLQELASQVMTTVNWAGNAQLTADVTALIQSIGVKIAANFNEATIAQKIMAPYQAVFANWYAKVAADVAAENTATPPIKLNCLKLVQASINGNITDLSSRVTNKVNQQLVTIQARFDALNVAVNHDLADIENDAAFSCGLDTVCFAQKIESHLPAASTKADWYIQQGVDAFKADVATATSKAAELDAIFVKRYTLIGQDLAKC